MRVLMHTLLITMGVLACISPLVIIITDHNGFTDPNVSEQTQAAFACIVLVCVLYTLAVLVAVILMICKASELSSGLVFGLVAVTALVATIYASTVFCCNNRTENWIFGSVFSSAALLVVSVFVMINAKCQANIQMI